jgi:5S rRNA maturation endonuclease (ribonuclease M5)
MEKYTGQKNIIITEAVLDAESIQLLDVEDTLAISTYRASYSISQFYYIMAVFPNTNIFVCYDQDRAGIENAKKLIDSSSRLFNKQVHMIELSAKDPNKVLTSKGVNSLKKEILDQLL